MFFNQFVASMMSRDTFLDIEYFLHLSDPLQLFRKRILLIRRFKKWSHIYDVITLKHSVSGENISIDESMISLGVTNLNNICKANKIWIVFALCDSLTGYLYKYQLYVGKKYQKLCIRDLVL